MSAVFHILRFLEKRYILKKEKHRLISVLKIKFPENRKRED